MYRPEKYRKDENAFFYEFIKKHPFATLVMNGQRLLATHIPVLPKGSATDFLLFSHMANHNEQQQYLKEGADALIIFQGPHAYVSASWYREKDISTWDYSAVHVNAKIRIQSREELELSLKELVAFFEKGEEKPLFYDEIPAKMLADHLPLITGFWLQPVKIEGISKHHQSYHPEDVNRVMDQLRKRGKGGDSQLADDLAKTHNL
ncbi:FMN-binding negative transcriptional regulator [Christiangramia flava]|uniref:Protease synthase and sporulation negative regulatory protein PAI 2 n=1 Tax=Christiangramia flava JLT2011 TaxID=1229726 RepID=A0A1L7I4I1_9FLAO|nr:FMN-binding negative transcriptional regulator [Christiangramia flava]APU68527.1 Protease synthase and sporulation negative regulatory protein PAI 2 [Christiangramia flava JLT2011]OSS40685.1 protease synthase and sporulation negative regulatory protein PAI 2 [Christiangramia flava JLT2011]